MRNAPTPVNLPYPPLRTGWAWGAGLRRPRVAKARVATPPTAGLPRPFLPPACLRPAHQPPSFSPDPPPQPLYPPSLPQFVPKDLAAKSQ